MRFKIGDRVKLEETTNEQYRSSLGYNPEGIYTVLLVAHPTPHINGTVINVNIKKVGWWMQTDLFTLVGIPEEDPVEMPYAI